MSINWPQALVGELAERRCVIVLGAGASAHAANDRGDHPPNWADFLEHGISLIRSPGDQDQARALVKKGAVLDAAQILADCLGSADFGMYVRRELEEPKFCAGDLHKTVIAIDPKIVVTTNYDQILESLATSGSAAEGYNVCRYYDSHLVNDLRSNRRLIVKAHGCTSDPQKIVLTRKQYFTARRECPAFFAALDAIFLTSTLLFIGTGFSGDPDIELMLQNVNISAPSAHPHYAVVPGGRHASVARAIEETYNIKFLEYPEGQHDSVNESLLDLADRVDSYRAVGP